MTSKLSIVRKLPKPPWEESHFPDQEPVDWHLDLAFLRRMWNLGQDTILETAFYEPFVKPHEKLRLIETDYPRGNGPYAAAINPRQP